jgi:hypothetical protein
MVIAKPVAEAGKMPLTAMQSTNTVTTHDGRQGKSHRFIMFRKWRLEGMVWAHMNDRRLGGAGGRARRVIAPELMLHDQFRM